MPIEFSATRTFERYTIATTTTVSAATRPKRSRSRSIRPSYSHFYSATIPSTISQGDCGSRRRRRRAVRPTPRISRSDERRSSSGVARRDRRWHFATEYEYSRMAIRTTDTAGGRSGHPRGRNSGRCAAENEYRIRSARCTNSRPRKLREVGPRGTRMPNRGRRGRKGMPRSAPPRPRGRRGVRRGGPTRRTRRRPPRSRRRGARPSWMYYPAP
mmetsp:Transcript_3882/g.6063  ORF Transcript_3882/g.6063 Transcript_3882/m.6063 type:complete len:214 (-) Transcript_3882:235-876(-)